MRELKPEAMYMNTPTGSVDTGDNWQAECEAGNFHPQDLDALCEVVKNDNDEWEEV